MSGASDPQKVELLFKEFNNTVNVAQNQTFSSDTNKQYPFRNYVLNNDIFSLDIPASIADFSVNIYGNDYYGIAMLDLSYSGAILDASNLGQGPPGYGPATQLGLSYELPNTNLTYYYKAELSEVITGNFQTFYIQEGEKSSGESLIRDSVPFNYDPSYLSYQPRLYDNVGNYEYLIYGTQTDEIPWLIDYKSGFVEYYTQDNTAAQILYNNTPNDIPKGTGGNPLFSFVVYNGPKGAAGGGGSGGDASFNNIDVSNLNVSNNLNVGNNLIVNNTISSLDNILLNKLTGNSVALTGNKLALTFNEMTTGPGFPPDHISLNGDFKVTIKTITGTLGIPTTVVLKFNAFYSCQIINGVETHKSRGINIISYTTNTDLSPSPPAVNQARLLDGIELGSISNASSLLVMINLDFNSNFFTGLTTLDFIEVEFTNNGANGTNQAQFDYWAPNTLFSIGNSNLQNKYSVDLKEVNSITNFTADKINLDGTIKLNGPVEFNGKVTGNIDVRTDIDISGNINFISGDISGVDNIFMSGSGLIKGVKDIYIGNDVFVGKDVSVVGRVITNGNNLLYKTSATNWNSEGSSGSGYVKYLANIFFNTSDDLTLCVDGTFRLYAETKLNNELFTHELIFNSGLNSSSSNNFTQDISGINQSLYIDLISSKCNSTFPLFKDLILKSRLTTVSSNQINCSLFVDTNSEVYGNLDSVELQVYNNNRNIPYSPDVPYNRFWNINENLNSQFLVGDPRISIIKGDLEKYKYISFMPDISGNNPNIPYPNNSMGALNYDTLKYGNNAFVDSYNMKSYTIEPPAGWYTIAQLGPDFNYNLKQIADGIFYIDTSYFSIDGVTQGQSLIFRAGIYYNNDPYIDVISNNSYQGYNVTQIRIAYDCDNQQGGTTCPTGGALVQVYSTTNSSSSIKQYLNVKCYENKGNKGWNLNDISYNNWNNGSANAPICYVDVEGFVDTNEYPDSRRPVLGSTYNQFLYSPLLPNGSNSSNKDMIYNGANLDISGGNLTVSDGIIELINSEISGNPITLHVNGLNYEFSNTGLEMEEKIINNVSLIDGSINDICGNITIQANSLPIDGSNSTTVNINNLLQMPTSSNISDISNSLDNFDSSSNGIFVYDTKLNLSAYKPSNINYQENASSSDSWSSSNPLKPGNRNPGGTNISAPMCLTTSSQVIRFNDCYNNSYTRGYNEDNPGFPGGPINNNTRVINAGGYQTFANVGGGANDSNGISPPYYDPSYILTWGNTVGAAPGFAVIPPNGISSPGYTCKTDTLITGAEFFIGSIYSGTTSNSDASLSNIDSFAAIKRPAATFIVAGDRPPSALCIAVHIRPSIKVGVIDFNDFIIGTILNGPDGQVQFGETPKYTTTPSGEYIMYTNNYPLFVPKNTHISPYLRFVENNVKNSSFIADELFLFGCPKLHVKNPRYVQSGNNIGYPIDISSCFSGFNLHINEYYSPSTVMNTYSVAIGGNQDVALW
ncbi:polymer-forming cytoskeletal protein [Candidatus Poseidonia alphae]|nr:polymer-forming cytoskeletal protein [Candidatus Poseidonia alphae]